MGRIMAIDFGAKTAGIALSDEAHMIASPLETVKRRKEGQLRPTLRRIAELAEERDVELIVVGLPLNMDDTKGERAAKSEAFGELLRKRLCDAGPAGIPVVMWDERLSTIEADEILSEAFVPAKDRKTYIDHIAAALILEDFLKNSGAAAD